jgi:hypothetical protein
MVHPLVKIATTRPHLLAEHASAYAELLADEVTNTASQIKRQLIFELVGLNCLMVAVTLIGVAAMLWAALPAGTINAPWLLAAAPAVPLAIGLWAFTTGGSMTPADPFAMVRRGAQPRQRVMSTQPPETPGGAREVPVMTNGELSPRERLTQSRQRISVWLEEDRDAPHAQMRSHNEGTHPVTAILKDVLSEWWRHHPLYTSVNITGDAARDAIVPLVRRYPIVVLGVAAVAGALLVRSRAWRWVVRPAVVAGLASQIVARAVSQMQSAAAAADRPDQSSHAAPASGPLAPPTGRAR